MDTQANLFLGLFQWRPSEKKTSSENFLTEAFVYCLRVNDRFRNFWLKEILGQDVSCEDLIITTRASRIDDERETTIYPDIEIRGTFCNGNAFALLIEVKWGAPYDRSQIKKYDGLLKNKENPYLVFISPSAMDCRKAESDSGKFCSRFQAVHWEQVHSHISAFSEHCRATRELGEFMDQQGLSAREPISSSTIDHYLASKDFIKRLRRYCEKLMHEFEWDFLPGIYHALENQTVKDQYGRIAIVLNRAGWDGTISIGFLYSNHDHKVKFADGCDNSVDLIMRIECAPDAAGRDEVVSIFKNKAAEAKRAGGVVRLADEIGNANRHTLFIAQKSLRKFVEGGSESVQLAAMHHQIRAWSNALFSDGELEVALSRFDEQAS